MAKKLSMSSKKLSKNNKTRKMSAGGKLPTEPYAVIKRAKKAIQKLLLNEDASKNEKLRATAEVEIAHANKHCGSDRRYWREEVLIISNKAFSDTIPNSSWYTKTRSIQWSLTKMPAWARNGKDEPNAGAIIEGKAYTKALPSQPR
jgi:hypothetical protein